jgi:DNA-binding IclR family transcriptional regulator
VGIHKSKGYSILNTLLDFGLVARDPSTKSYSLGAGALVLSRSLLDSMDLRQAVAPFLRRLVHETGSTALLGLRLAGGVVVAAKEEAGAGIGVSIRVGHRYPLTWGAHGKAMVAFLPVAERTAALEEATLYFWGEGGGSAELRARLPQELAAVRNLGYAKDLGAVQPGVQAVSAPIFGSRGKPTACLIVVGTFATDRADPFGALVAATAAEVSALYGPILEAFRRDG